RSVALPRAQRIPGTRCRAPGGAGSHGDGRADQGGEGRVRRVVAEVYCSSFWIESEPGSDFIRGERLDGDEPKSRSWSRTTSGLWRIRLLSALRSRAPARAAHRA